MNHVGTVVAQWHTERPDLDASPMEVIGRLSIVSRLVDAQLRQTFARHELDAPSFDVLATLRRSGPPYQLTPTQLTRSAMVTSGAITQRLDRLEARGLISRGPRSDDGRGVQVTLTPTGYNTIDAALPDHLATEQRLLAALSEKQRRALAVTLQQLIDSVDSILTPEG